ncbi:DUF1214 domain-containing protein [Paraburkholderia sp. J63]|uniref:DUF1214 domain-containing protein n=1 Tax=Paraburkholderia sp. J63 TaxID=2805434 RepID=UPI002ABDC7BD|nr:DUF1214 domain-containing protein [Paraburkholderia sp. J63]
MSHPVTRRAVLQALLVAGISGALPLCTVRSEASQPDADTYRLGSRAYVYGFPMIYLSRLRYVRMTTGDPVTGEHHRWGAWAHRDRTITPSMVGAPQTDTLYSDAWLDLAREPYLLEIPHTDGRYWSIQCCDFLGATFGLPNRRTVQGKAVIALVGPDWSGPLPDDVSYMYRAGMREAFLVMRLFFADEADRTKATALQKALTMYPLSERARKADWQGIVALPPCPAQAGSDRLADFRTLQTIWQSCPPPAYDQPLTESFRPIDLYEGAAPGFDNLSPEARDALAQAEADARSTLHAGTHHFPGNRSANGWVASKRAAGLYDDGDYVYRAAVTMLGTVALPVTENVYYVAQTDGGGAPLNGSRRYVVRFAPGQLPACHAFWSMHAYRYAGYTVMPNTLDRYSIGDRTPGIQFDADGGLTIRIQSAGPAPEETGNWLPVAEDTDFFLIIRGYEPVDVEASLAWLGPTIRQLS